MIIYIYLNRIEVSPDDLEDELIMDDSLTPMERIYMFNKSDMIIHRYQKGWRESEKKRAWKEEMEGEKICSFSLVVCLVLANQLYILLLSDC